VRDNNRTHVRIFNILPAVIKRTLFTYIVIIFFVVDYQKAKSAVNYDFYEQSLQSLIAVEKS
jgi:hypothetical protein